MSRLVRFGDAVIDIDDIVCVYPQEKDAREVNVVLKSGKTISLGTKASKLFSKFLSSVVVTEDGEP